MLAKCSNPLCFAPFRRLGDGQLYLLEVDPPPHTDRFERTEYFWLCDACSATLTLRLAEDERVVAVPLPEGIPDAHNGVSLVSRDRKKGLLLRRVSAVSEHLGLVPRHEGKRRSRPHDREDWEEETAAAAICPVPECNALAISYRPLLDVAAAADQRWDFTCPRCEIEFTVAKRDLIFHSVPKDWLLARIHPAWFGPVRWC